MTCCFDSKSHCSNLNISEQNKHWFSISAEVYKTRCFKIVCRNIFVALQIRVVNRHSSLHDSARAPKLLLRMRRAHHMYAISPEIVQLIGFIVLLSWFSWYLLCYIVSIKPTTLPTQLRTLHQHCNKPIAQHPSFWHLSEWLTRLSFYPSCYSLQSMLLAGVAHRCWEVLETEMLMCMSASVRQDRCHNIFLQAVLRSMLWRARMIILEGTEVSSDALARKMPGWGVSVLVNRSDSHWPPKGRWNDAWQLHLHLLKRGRQARSHSQHRDVEWELLRQQYLKRSHCLFADVQSDRSSLCSPEEQYHFPLRRRPILSWRRGLLRDVSRRPLASSGACVWMLLEISRFYHFKYFRHAASVLASYLTPNLIATQSFRWI